MTKKFVESSMASWQVAPEQTANERAGAGDVAGLRSDLVAAAEDDVLDRARVDSGAVHERVERVRPQVGGVEVGESPAPAPSPLCPAWNAS